MSKVTDKLTLIAITCMIATSCIDQVKLDVRSDKRNISINGQITNLPEPYTVTVKRSAAFSGDEFDIEEPVLGALVTLRVNDGREVVLDAVEAGVYQSNPQEIVGQIGKTYWVNVSTPDGEVYQSGPETLLPVPSIDEVSFKFLIEEELNEVENIVERKKVDVMVNTRLSENPENIYFKWDVTGEYEFRESEALTDIFATTGVGPLMFTCYVFDNIRLGDVAVFEGSSIVGSSLSQQVIKSIDVDYKFTFNYCVHVRQQSLTAKAYAFWHEVGRSVNRSGGLFEAPAGNVQGNIRNMHNPSEMVHGYFYASAISTDRLFIPPDSVRKPVSPCLVIDPEFEGPCMDCLELENSIRNRPDYWPE